MFLQILCSHLRVSVSVFCISTKPDPTANLTTSVNKGVGASNTSLPDVTTTSPKSECAYKLSGLKMDGGLQCSFHLQAPINLFGHVPVMFLGNSEIPNPVTVQTGSPPAASVHSNTVIPTTPAVDRRDNESQIYFEFILHFFKFGADIQLQVMVTVFVLCCMLSQSWQSKACQNVLC